MAKASKTKAAKEPALTESAAVNTNAAGANSGTQEAPVKKGKMSKEDAQGIVNKYSGINGAFVPAELKQAREVLKGE